MNISVIIPVYNCQNYLERAVRSIISQSYDKTDIIIVDDGSTDNSPEICDKLAATESHIHVIHKSNGGVSSARNAGIEYVLSQHALSERVYIAFLDADDVWEQNFLDSHVARLLHQSYDLLGFRTYTYDCNLLRTNLIKAMPQEGEFTGGKNSVWLHSSQHFASMLYSATLLRTYHIRFHEGIKYSEDKIFSMQCMFLADRIWLENKPMYSYIIHGFSAMGSRKFGIPYYMPIIEAYLDSDKAMLQWANEQRGELWDGRVAAAHYIGCMIEEHYQCWRPHKEIKELLSTHPHFIALLKADPPYQLLKSSSIYASYVRNPYAFRFKHYSLGLIHWMRRATGMIIKKFTQKT
jgi:glycosyltransferase involved in cell wall biosynthesis